MAVSFFHQIHWSDGGANFFEEYCAVVPQAFGRSIKHYQQIDQEHAVPFAPSPKSGWKNTAQKILIFVSHCTLVVPLVMYTGKAIQRQKTSLKIAPPGIQRLLENSTHLKEAVEIRRLREDDGYVPDECKKIPIPIRQTLPADSILEELYPELKDLSFLEKISYFNEALPHDLECKQEQILQPNFNGFHCAHGIENLKGGKRNLLNVMLEGVLRAPHAGGLQNGRPDYAAGPHGPYYVILNPNDFNRVLKTLGLWHCVIFDRDGYNQALQRLSLWHEESQVAFLVPSSSDRQFLEQGLSKAVERGYITEEEKFRSLRKVITYDEFIQLPFEERRHEKKLQAWLEKGKIQ